MLCTHNVKFGCEGKPCEAGNQAKDEWVFSFDWIKQSINKHRQLGRQQIIENVSMVLQQHLLMELLKHFCLACGEKSIQG
jgi:hypothetical protein